MCGISSIILKNNSAHDVALKAVGKMNDQMANRGPDASSIWSNAGVVLGHRRLSIQDLDSRANQPFVSGCGRYVIVYNGEVYNFLTLRNELHRRGLKLKTNSDTEVIVELFALHGVAMLHRLRGMFSLVIWDNVSKKALIARDPYGIKPLYWSQSSVGLVVASQVRAILSTNLIEPMPCPRGQAGYWLLGSVPEPYTWFKNVNALRAGHYAWVVDGEISSPECWFDVSNAWRDAAVRPEKDFNLVQELTHEALRQSVKDHMVADVPVGIFLSGGIDSGSLAGLMIDAGASNLQGVTITYDEFSGSDNDESPIAARIAKHYGISHHIRRVSRSEFERDLPIIMGSMDQPSIDGINSWYASKAVAEIGLKVVVSGVGGDELFQGYSSFKELPLLSSLCTLGDRVPGLKGSMRLAASLLAKKTSNDRWRHLPDWGTTLTGAWWLRRSLFSPSELQEFISSEVSSYILDNFDLEKWMYEMCGTISKVPILAVGQIESTTYMRNQLLRDSDWASMAHSVELRTPLVDAFLLRELSPFLNQFYRFPNKRLLASAPLKPLPDAIIHRKKTGFGIPVHKWISEIGESGTKLNSKTNWAKFVVKNYESF